MEDNRFLLLLDDEKGVWKSKEAPYRVIHARTEEEAASILQSESEKGHELMGGFIGPTLFQQVVSKPSSLRSERLAAFGQIARGIGHELANVLLRIMGKIDLSLLSNDPNKMHEHLKVAMKASERAGLVLKNLQSVSKNQPFLQVESILAPLELAITQLGPDLAKLPIEVERKFEEVPALPLDHAKVTQVFFNLILNSIQAMPEGGKITISVSKLPNPTDSGAPGILVRIVDSGAGIPADLMPHLFEYAFNVQGGRRSGLGLLVSKNTMEAHHGKIWFNPQPPFGTEVSLWFPL